MDRKSVFLSLNILMNNNDFMKAFSFIFKYLEV